jgi:hypothetical protein
MDKQQIAQLLEEKGNVLCNWLEQQDIKNWVSGPEGKWTTGQQAKHVLESIKPLNTALSLPKFILKYKYGKANREVRDYDTVVDRYLQRLEEAKGTVSPFSKGNKIPKAKDKNYFLNRLKVENKKLQHKTKKWSDHDLDTYILPHPLMGQMPIRELLMWTAYHIEHHTKTLMEKY